ncbi:hypothetical protein TVAGG3_0079670, partial [Trichomonas vaginalis G3]|uniref:hypothetical protein n=1 Tax=Trichomonas vaginalis (strain ATCC PRA-98 / G3) TaxID=412133 RepID=UPI0021E52C57
MDEEPDIPNLESIPQHTAEKLLQLGKLVPRQKLNAANLSDTQVSLLMSLIEDSLDPANKGLIEILAKSTNVCPATLYNYRKKYELDPEFNPKTAAYLINRAISDHGEELLANYIIKEFIEK